VIISIDGTLVAPEDAKISVLDRGVLYGDGLFEILRTWSGVAVDLDAHLARLAESARALALELRSELRAWTLAAIASPPADVRVRIAVTRGPGALRERLASLRGGGRTIILVEPLAAATTADTSLAVVDSPIARRGPGVKSLAYLEHLVARELAAVAGADDAVRLDPAGNVVECATSNLFLVEHGTVATPPLSTGALPGVVRARVLAACRRLGVPAAERTISLAELRAADEIFVTSSLRGVVPVTRLDGAARPAGPLTAQLAADHIDEMSALASQLRARVLL
jgi:branched-chain amino acid aminotransferase